MNLRDLATATPLGGVEWNSRLEINSNATRSRRMILAGVIGEGESELAAHLLRVVLEGMPHTRVGFIGPESIWIRDVELPRKEWCGTPGIQQMLQRMADAGCTHVVLHMDRDALEGQEYAGLHMSVTALTAPAGPKDALEAVMAASDTVVLNLDEKAWEDYGNIIPEHTFTYSENKTWADLTAKNLRLFPGHMEFDALTVGHIQRIHLPVPGGFALYHSLCVLSCGLCLGLKWERMARVMRSVRGPRGRLEVLSVPAAYTVVLDRADTARALEQLLTSVREFAAGQVVCVLGCPHGGSAARRAELGGVAEQLADRIILSGHSCAGEEQMSRICDVRRGMGAWHRPCTVEPDRRQAIQAALEKAGPGDVIVLAGGSARGADERELVRDWISNRYAGRKKEAPAEL